MEKCAKRGGRELIKKGWRKGRKEDRRMDHRKAGASVECVVLDS